MRSMVYADASDAAGAASLFLQAVIDLRVWHTRRITRCISCAQPFTSNHIELSQLYVLLELIVQTLHLICLCKS